MPPRFTLWANPTRRLPFSVGSTWNSISKPFCNSSSAPMPELISHAATPFSYLLLINASHRGIRTKSRRADSDR
jgi:hypothetical protein